MPLMHDRLEPLTGLRAVAAYSVLIAHAISVSFLKDVPAELSQFSSRLAWFGMSLFFVLSGFVIHYNYAEGFRTKPLGRATWDFFAARFARLYPLYAVSIFVSLPHIPMPDERSSIVVLFSYLTLTQAWNNVPMAVFAPAWSVSTECFFYLAFVPLVFVVSRILRPVLVLGVYCVLTLALLLVVLNVWGEALGILVDRWLHVNKNVSSPGWGYVIYMGPPIRLLEFIAGMLAAQAFLALRSREISQKVMTVILSAAFLWCMAGLALPNWSWLTPIRSNFLYAPGLAAFLVCICLSRGTLSQLLSSRVMVFLGEISYSVYVWSFFVMTALAASYVSPQWSAEATANSVIKIFNIAALTTIFAYGSYLLIEVPSRRWLRAALGAVGARRRETVLGRVESKHPSPGRG